MRKNNNNNKYSIINNSTANDDDDHPPVVTKKPSRYTKENFFQAFLTLSLVGQGVATIFMHRIARQFFQDLTDEFPNSDSSDNSSDSIDDEDGWITARQCFIVLMISGDLICRLLGINLAEYSHALFSDDEQDQIDADPRDAFGIPTWSIALTSAAALSLPYVFYTDEKPFLEHDSLGNYMIGGTLSALSLTYQLAFTTTYLQPHFRAWREWRNAEDRLPEHRRLSSLWEKFVKACSIFEVTAQTSIMGLFNGLSAAYFVIKIAEIKEQSTDPFVLASASLAGVSAFYIAAMSRTLQIKDRIFHRADGNRLRAGFDTIEDDFETYYTHKNVCEKIAMLWRPTLKNLIFTAVRFGAVAYLIYHMSEDLDDTSSSAEKSGNNMRLLVSVMSGLSVALPQLVALHECSKNQAVLDAVEEGEVNVFDAINLLGELTSFEKIQKIYFLPPAKFYCLPRAEYIINAANFSGGIFQLIRCHVMLHDLQKIFKWDLNFEQQLALTLLLLPVLRADWIERTQKTASYYLAKYRIERTLSVDEKPKSMTDVLIATLWKPVAEYDDTAIDNAKQIIASARRNNISKNCFTWTRTVDEAELNNDAKGSCRPKLCW